jgi:hypothetical protein
MVMSGFTSMPSPCRFPLAERLRQMFEAHAGAVPPDPPLPQLLAVERMTFSPDALAEDCRVADAAGVSAFGFMLCVPVDDRGMQDALIAPKARGNAVLNVIDVVWRGGVGRGHSAASMASPLGCGRGWGLELVVGWTVGAAVGFGALTATGGR